MIETIVSQLRSQAAKLDRAIAALSALNGEKRGGYRGPISPEGRAKISAAMKARWAKARK